MSDLTYHPPGPDLPGGEFELLDIWHQGSGRDLYADVLRRGVVAPPVREMAEREVAARPYPLTALAANARLARLLVASRWSVIRDAIESGASWEEVAAALGEPVSRVAAAYRLAIARQEQRAVLGYDAERARAVLASAPEPQPVAPMVADLLRQSCELSEETAARCADVLESAAALVSPEYAEDIAVEARRQAEAEHRAELEALREQVRGLEDRRDAAELVAAEPRDGHTTQPVRGWQPERYGAPFGPEYTTRTAARAHCEEAMIRGRRGGVRPSLGWQPDDRGGERLHELTGAAGPTGYRIVPVGGA